MMDKYFKNQLHFYTSNKQQFLKRHLQKRQKKVKYSGINVTRDRHDSYGESPW